MIEHLVRIQFFVEIGADHETPKLVAETIKPLGRNTRFEIPVLDASAKEQGFNTFFIVELFQKVEV